jgi:hypothetical protein
MSGLSKQFPGKSHWTAWSVPRPSRGNDGATDTGTGGFRREELLLEAEGILRYLCICWCLSPRTRAAPCVLALHGHGEFGHHPIAGRDDLPGVAKSIAAANYDYGRQLASRGYVVACPCFTPFGDRLGNREAFGRRDPCEDVFLRLLALGRVLMGENLRDALWALNVSSCSTTASILSGPPASDCRWVGG